MRTRQLFASLVVVLLAACGGSEKKSAADQAKTLVIALKSGPTNLDSRVGSDNASSRMFDLVYSGLIKVTPNFDYAPDLATKWETPDDKTIIFHLNPAAKFHNGQPVKAADVKWTYESMMNPTFVTSKRSGYSTVDHIETPDEQTVIFKLKEANAGIFDNLTTGILPTGADTNVYKTMPIGCGPYRLVKHLPDDRLEFEAFDQWHGGAPPIKHITVRIIPDATTCILEMRRGSVNFEVNIIPFENVAEFEKNPDFKVVKSNGSVYQYLAFNMKDPALAKPLVRQAIAHAIDRERIIRDIQRGFAQPTETMLAEGHWARATNLPTYAYDPAKARKLLAQAGYPKGLNLTFKTSTDAEANSRAQVMQAMMKEAGFNVTIQSNEMSTFFADISKGNFQMYSLSRNGISDPDFYYVIFYSKNEPPNGQNRGYYNNPRLDQLMIDGHSTFDRAKRKPIYDEVQKIVATDLPYLSLYMQSNVAIMRKNIDGYVQYPAGFYTSIPQMTMK
ncbi:MAG: peptide/nickel transport system substrate-binding protein [Thermoanaerobaculia bacterium]|jgi:peptide/nickel transport system substrate-binding protein|nr:peptide/nickel transport system substrate-binding protein [Thermoanaerobaculia bacterium]